MKNSDKCGGYRSGSFKHSTFAAMVMDGQNDILPEIKCKLIINYMLSFQLLFNRKYGLSYITY